MKVKNSLPAVGVGVYYNAVAVIGDASAPGYLRCGQKQMAEHCLILVAGLIERLDMLTRHHQNVDRSVRAKVVEGNALLVLIKRFRRQLAADDLAKDAVIRAHNSFVY